MIATTPALASMEDTLFSLLVLAVSVFCLTSLDTATRLARYMFQELWLAPGETVKDTKGWKAILANQLLAALALLAVCCWLGNIGKNNKMFYIPMFFMLVMTLWSLVNTIIAKFGAIAAGTADAADWMQGVLGVALLILAVILVIEGAGALAKQGKKQSANK